MTNNSPLKKKWPADAVERRPIDSLVPYARNSRTHSDEQVAQIAASMREWGWTNPVLVDEEGGIIAGHGRIMAARQLGLTEVPCMVANGWTEAQKRAYVIADNKLALNAGWDLDTLGAEFRELADLGFDCELTGFDGDELESLMADDPPPEVVDAGPVDPPEDPVTRSGDVWELGRHLILCGDSSKDLESFAEGFDADLILMDPPYEVEESWRWTLDTPRAIVFTDHKHIAEAMQIALQYDVIYHFVWDTVISWYTANRPLCRHRSAFFCSNDHGWDGESSAYVDDSNRSAKVINGGSFGGEYNYEPLSGGRVRLQSVFRQSKSAEEAGNGKPVQWIRSLLGGCGAKRVIEPFGGTGATLVAAPEGCSVRSIEVDPAKVDSIVKRWEIATGGRAVKRASGAA